MLIALSYRDWCVPIHLLDSKRVAVISGGRSCKIRTNQFGRLLKPVPDHDLRWALKNNNINSHFVKPKAAADNACLFVLSSCVVCCALSYAYVWCVCSVVTYLLCCVVLCCVLKFVRHSSPPPFAPLIASSLSRSLPPSVLSSRVTTFRSFVLFDFSLIWFDFTEFDSYFTQS